MVTVSKQKVIDYIDEGLEYYNGKRWLNEEAVAFIKTIRSRVEMITDKGGE